MTGTRIMAAYVVPGGVREDIDEKTAAQIRAAIDHVEAELPRFVKMFSTGPMIALRSKGIGILTAQDAKESGSSAPPPAPAASPATPAARTRSTPSSAGT